jgi:hypothetical protein
VSLRAAAALDHTGEVEPTPSEPDLCTRHELVPVLRELLAREPLFHRRSLVGNRSDFERETDESFWEVGASGRRYSREFVWSVLRSRLAGAADDAPDDDGRISEAQVRDVGPDTYLLTYTLQTADSRVTRRSTVWRGSAGSGWRALFHQGTVVEGTAVEGAAVEAPARPAPES